MSAFLTRIGRWGAVLLPLFLTHVRVGAEIDLDLLAGMFLVQSALTRQWEWVRSAWVVALLCWWGWAVFCTAVVSPGHGALGQSLAAIRFPLAAASLGFWLLRDEVWRRRVVWVTCLCGVYIALQMLLQAVIGHNLFGDSRFGDGTLTGPYDRPRAAAPLSRLIPLIVMVVCAGVASWKGWLSRLLAICGVTLACLVVMVLAGQRMPFMLSLLGIMVCGLLYRPMRPAALVGLVSVPVLVFAASVVSPGSFRHLFLLARTQLTHFGQSPYGQIYTHGLVMAGQHPVLGQGYDAYRHHCADPATFHGLSWFSADRPLKGWLDLCVQHPHNHYLQALVNGGVPGLVLFVVMVVLMLRAIWPGRSGEAVQIGLLAGFFIQEWPIASTSDFLNLPLGGWGFLLFGLGLAFVRGGRVVR